jgi:hypothetical protein
MAVGNGPKGSGAPSPGSSALKSETFFVSNWLQSSTQKMTTFGGYPADGVGYSSAILAVRIAVRNESEI